MVKKTEDGIDLAETMVAIILIVSAILALTTMLIRSQIMQADNEAQARATLLVQDTVERTHQISYQDLATGNKNVSPSSATCATTADNSTAAEKKAFEKKLGCYDALASRKETYILSKHSPIPYIEKKEVSGTEYTIGFHVTSMNKARSGQLGWTVLSPNSDGSKCDNVANDSKRLNPEANPYESDISRDPDYTPLCTVKHVTVEVSWKDTSGNVKSTSSSWMRTPQTHEEVPPNVLES